MLILDKATNLCLPLSWIHVLWRSFEVCRQIAWTLSVSTIHRTNFDKTSTCPFYRPNSMNKSRLTVFRWSIDTILSILKVEFLITLRIWQPYTQQNFSQLASAVSFMRQPHSVPIERYSVRSMKRRHACRMRCGRMNAALPQQNIHQELILVDFLLWVRFYWIFVKKLQIISVRIGPMRQTKKESSIFWASLLCFLQINRIVQWKMENHRKLYPKSINTKPSSDRKRLQWILPKTARRTRQ